MGKIRIKHIGAAQEEEEKKKAKLRRLAKKQKKKTAKTPGLKGGERVVAVGPSIEELEKTLKRKPEAGSRKPEDKGQKPEGKPEAGRQKAKIRPPKKPSRRYQKLAKIINKEKLYSPAEAIKLLKKLANARFPETLEAHMSLKRVFSKSEQAAYQKHLASALKQASGGTDAAGKGTLLGNKRGAPKTCLPARQGGAGAVNSLKAASATLHFEKKFPAAHAALGKISQPAKLLEKNLNFLVKTLNAANIKKLTLSTTMSPSLKISF